MKAKAGKNPMEGGVGRAKTENGSPLGCAGPSMRENAPAKTTDMLQIGTPTTF